MPNLFSDQRFPDLKIAAAQLLVIPGDVEANTANIISEIAKARANGAHIVVFPELAVTGYLLGDRFEEDDFLKEIMIANDTIREASFGIVAIWGSIVSDFKRRGEDGRTRKYNTACVAQDGEWVSNGVLSGCIPKTNLPKYRMFDDARHFFSAGQLAKEMNMPIEQMLYPFRIDLVTLNCTIRLGVTLCEDLWDDDYQHKPALFCKQNHADIIINISCSPWTCGKTSARDNMLKRRAIASGLPIVYVNAVGLQNNVKNLIWFDGGSTAVSAKGEILWRMSQHESALGILPGIITETPKEHTSGIAEIHDSLIAAMKQFYAPFPKVIIGLSGGIDSAVQLALTVEAIGAEKVLAINMPTKYNSNTTKDLARICAENFGVEYRVVPIQGLYESHQKMLKAAGYENPPMLVLENIQARIRSASVLAAIAQAEGGVFTCNGNKTEMALNYFTLYGDGAGVAAFLADLWKGQIYDLANFMNEQAYRKLVPRGIIDLNPSAELSRDQNVDEGKGDPIFYPYHDQLLKAFTEKRWGIAHVMRLISADTLALELELGCAPGTIAKYFKTKKAFVDNLEWAWERYCIEWKRGQTPPCFLTSRRAFGFDRRDTIAPNPLSHEYLALKEHFLGNDRVNDPRDI